MKKSIKNPVCPHCQQPARGALELIPAMMEFHGDPRQGAVEYLDGPNLDWNKQKAITGETGLPLVACVNGHQWESPIEFGT